MRASSFPLCLIVPDPQQGRRRWPNRLAETRDDCVLIEIDPEMPRLRNLWLNRIDHAVGTAARPVILVGENLGALAIVWWASLLGKTAARRVCGALLVRPADPENFACGDDAFSFAPLPTAMLPFPSIVVGAEDDRLTSAARHRDMAGEWLSDFVTIDHASLLQRSRWQGGEQLLELLQAGGPGLSRDLV